MIAGFELFLDWRCSKESIQYAGMKNMEDKELKMKTFQLGTEIFMGELDISSVCPDTKSVFIVTDKFLVESGRITYVTEKLEAAGIPYYVFSDVVPNPDIELVMKGISIIDEFKPDTVISFGGGSAIDTAKGIMYFAVRTAGLPRCLSIAIPTTSGTGSEVTRFSIISDHEKNIKYPLVDDSLLPDIAVLDAHLTVSVPPAITADTGMDVLTHAMEAYVSANATDFSDALAEKAFKMAFDSLRRAYHQGDDLEARENMHHASCLAGMAFDSVSLGVNHGMAHILGIRASLPHGRANAVLLPYVIAYNAGIQDVGGEKESGAAKKYARLAKLAGYESYSVRSGVVNLIHGMEKLCREFKMPLQIKDAWEDQSAFEASVSEMSRIACEDRCTATNPRKCLPEKIETVFREAYYGKSKYLKM